VSPGAGRASIHIPLRLVAEPPPAREDEAERQVQRASAWLAPGDSAAEWLALLAPLCRALGIPMARLALFRLPEGAGALAVPDDEALLAALLPATTGEAHPRLRPYRRVGRLLLPLEADALPRPTAAETQALLEHDAALHPGLGLVALPPEAALRASDLLAVATVPGRPWRPLDPPTAGLRLTAVDVLRGPSLELFLAGGAGGVGESPGRPPAEETPGWAGEAAARLVRWASGAEPPARSEKTAEGSAAGKPPGEPGGGGLLGRLRSWSERTLEQLDQARSREVDRLLRLLERDPDEGLRYALPVAGTSPARGAGPAPPSANLPPRLVDYDGAAGGRRGPTDGWDLDAEVTARLARRYRELADRELRLQRFRRAAYIFANLLGDLTAAAAALAAGGHVREAAQLYDERLGRPLEAARVLERGGLLAEAATAYEKVGQWVQAGDLHARVERRADAERCWRRAVRQRLEAGDVASAARHLEEKLARPDEALELLATTWPAHPQAGLCLEDRLGLLGRLGRHEAARRLLDQLREDPRRAGRELVVARSVGGVAARYPDRSVQARARDLVRVVAGERLPQAGPLEVDALVAAISKLEPGDAALARDGARWSQQRRREPAPAAPVGEPRTLRLPRPGFGPGASLVRELSLWPRGLARWRHAVARGGALWAVGELASNAGVEADVVLSRIDAAALRGEARGRTGALAMWRAPWARDLPLRLAPPHGRLVGAPCLVFSPPSRHPFPVVTNTTDELPAPLDAGTPGWLPPPGAADQDQDGVVWAAYVTGDDVVVSRHEAVKDGALLGSTSLGPLSPGARIEHLVASHGRGWLAVCTAASSTLHLVEAATGDGERRWGFEQRITALVESSDGRHLAVAFDRGGVVFSRGRPERFGEGLEAARLAFTAGDELLVAVVRGEGRSYALEEGRLVRRSSFQAPDESPVAVLATGTRREVAIVLEGGRVQLFKLD
jgi:tetratricopeptide (TPR) repeat protein